MSKISFFRWDERMAMASMAPFEDLLLVFGLGLMALLLCHRLRLSPILGFLITGLLCGPHGFSLIDNQALIETLAEVGIMLLLFSIGLDFNQEKLRDLGRMIFLGGASQVLMASLGCGGIALLLGFDPKTALVCGVIFSLSSTALVLRRLEQQRQVQSLGGRNSLALLIFQDLCVIFLFLLLPLTQNLSGDLTAWLMVIGKALLMIVFTFLLARSVVPYLLDLVVKTRRREAFLLVLIFFCLGTAWVSAQAQLSVALGAFCAGMVIASSPWSHHALSEILSLREIFNCLFFVAMGMKLNFEPLWVSPMMVLSLLVLFSMVKIVTTTVGSMIAGLPLRVALFSGFALAQASEFSLVILEQAAQFQILSFEHSQLFLCVAALSLFVFPFFDRLRSWLLPRLEQRLPRRIALGKDLEIFNFKDDDVLNDHVVIVGFGLTGQKLAQGLKDMNQPFVVIEMNPETIEKARLDGIPILYGDASQSEILHRAACERARLMVVAIPDTTSIVRCLDAARRMNPQLQSIVRALWEPDVAVLKKAGADQVVSQELEAALEIMTRCCEALNLESSRQEALREVTRQEHLSEAAPRLES